MACGLGTIGHHSYFCYCLGPYCCVLGSPPWATQLQDEAHRELWTLSKWAQLQGFLPQGPYFFHLPLTWLLRLWCISAARGCFHLPAQMHFVVVTVVSPVGSNLDSNVTRSTYQTDHDDRDFDPRFTSREFLSENAITDKLLDKASDSKELVLNMTMNSIFAQGDPINSVGSHIDSLYVDYEDTDGIVTYTINGTYMELSNGKAINSSAETPFSNATVTMTSSQGNRTHKAR